MSYFVPRPRNVNIIDGSFAEVEWPAKCLIRAKLVPLEFFGLMDTIEPRSILPGTPKRILFNANNGKVVVESENFLPKLRFETQIGNKISLSLDGNVLTIDGDINSSSDLYHGLTLVEYYVPVYLSLSVGTYLRADEITGEVGNKLRFNYEMKEVDCSVLIMNESERTEKIRKALDFIALTGPSVDRFFLACIYFQQALRVGSPHEVDIPSAHVSEVTLNLAKCVEILFSGETETIRLECAKLGYPKEQIESQIIPLMIIRSKMDIAHPVSGDLAHEDVKVIVDFANRSIHNVQNLLLRVAHRLEVASDAINPLTPSHAKAKEREKLISVIRQHLKQPPLPEEMKSSNGTGSFRWLLDAPDEKPQSSELTIGDESQSKTPNKKLPRFAPGVRYSNSASHHLKRGANYYNDERYDDAKAEFRKAILADPDMAQAHFGLALSLVANEEHDAALEELDRVIILAPEHSDVYFFKGMLISQKLMLKPDKGGMNYTSQQSCAVSRVSRRGGQ